ncbi:hypothetical protein [Thalassobellus suaedae]|uniref:Uncharacterized protein n=1 Tax=Thalassobellus suaedae TaxID=3074124 RepID=A0ABY9XXF6_9FLAO|nr:hypothetical protein RHP51_07880 [Flavobacteriaceae bacterium HL-DH14]
MQGKSMNIYRERISMGAKLQVSGLIFMALFLLIGCMGSKERNESNLNFDVDKQLDYCVTQSEKTIALNFKDQMIPRNVATNSSAWRLVEYKDWTSGF